MDAQEKEMTEQDYLVQLVSDVRVIGQSVTRQEEVLGDYKEKLDRIYRVVIGNGSDDGIITRLILLEKSDEEHCESLDELTREVRSISKRLDTELQDIKRNETIWRNRVIGLGIGLTILNAMLLIFGG
jgi:hypothetical protein